MNPVEIIVKKRNRQKLTNEEIRFLIDGFLAGKVADYQMSAFLMAVYFNGMEANETYELTKAMLHSGVVLYLTSIPGKKVDKHSTGGVGDKTSLILAPVVAAAGLAVPMISGRGLGHTGGTLDKLEAIPGFTTGLSMENFIAALNKVGCGLIGQTKEIAPADKVIYALRDVTGTVESIPLICASIMSKKLAEGMDALVLDVKTGRGAFMKSYEDSLNLAVNLKSISDSFGKKTIAMITRMDEPLGFAVGNWLEIVESIECLQGKNVPDLMEVTLNLAGAMIYLGDKAASIEEGIEISKEMIHSGQAFNKFLEIAQFQGADPSFLKKPDKYPKPKQVIQVKAETDGFISNIDSHALGMAGIELGAGRMKVDDIIDPKAGMMFSKKEGDFVKRNDTVLTVFTDIEKPDLIIEKIKNSFSIVDKPEPKKELIVNILREN